MTNVWSGKVLSFQLHKVTFEKDGILNTVYNDHFTPSPTKMKVTNTKCQVTQTARPWHIKKQQRITVEDASKVTTIYATVLEK